MSAEPIDVTEVVSDTTPDCDSGAANGPSDPPILATVNGGITEVDPVVAARRIAELETAAEATVDLAEKAVPPSTRRAREGDWRHFTNWCDRYGLRALPAEPSTVALYVGAHSTAHKPATIRRRLSSISVRHQEAGHPTPTKHPGVRKVVKGLHRTYGAASESKAAATTDTLRRFVEAIDTSRLIGVRDRAILLVGFACAFRRSEVVGFDMCHVEERPKGLAIRLPWSKTNQDGDLEEVGAEFGQDPATCPVRAWRDWLHVSGIEEGPPFRPVTRHGTIRDRRLSGRAVAEVVKRTAVAAGEDPARFAGHSLRSGFITSAIENRVAEDDVMRQSRHKSIPVFRKYRQKAELFIDNASGKVGL